MSTYMNMKKTWISSSHQGFITEGVHQNTLAAYLNSAKKGADMIETDERTTRDGVIVANHDATVKAYNENGEFVEYTIAETDYADLAKLRFFVGSDEGAAVPTLESVLHLAYFTGMCVNIDLKEGAAHAEEIAHMVVGMGMSGRVVYATNGSGAETINNILKIDPDARFIDTKKNYTKEKLASVENYPSKCFVYTSDFSDQNIAEIRESGCLLATISLNANNAKDAFRHHPDMAEYPHTSDFEAIDNEILNSVKFW